MRDRNFDSGDVHKLITLDTPFNGSDFAKKFYDSSKSCKDLFAIGGHGYNHAVEDLVPGSSTLNKLSTQVGGTHIFVSAIVGIATLSQQEITEDNWRTSADWKVGLLRSACDQLLPRAGFFDVFQQDSDLIVSRDSQSAIGLEISGITIPTKLAQGVVHSVDPTVFVAGPSILGNTINDNGVSEADANQAPKTVQLLIDLLNSNISGIRFTKIKP
jgi:hypothetical protein